MKTLELETCFIRIKAIANAMDKLIESSYTESEDEINVLSQILVETCEEYSKIVNTTE